MFFAASMHWNAAVLFHLASLACLVPVVADGRYDRSQLSGEDWLRPNLLDARGHLSEPYVFLCPSPNQKWHVCMQVRRLLNMEHILTR